MSDKLKIRIRCLAALVLITVVVIILGFRFWIPARDAVFESQVQEISYVEFRKKLEAKQLTLAYYDKAISYLICIDAEGQYYKTTNPKYETFMSELLEYGLILRSPSEFKNAEQIESNRRATMFGFLGAIVSILTIVLFVKTSDKEGVSGKINIISRKKAAAGYVDEKSMTEEEAKSMGVKKFSDIAGLYEVKKDVQCLVDFLVNKEKYMEAGATLPKGIILYGPPGTGKTLLAKAIAGEAGVPFLYMSGSEFVEMYVGVGAKRVRELFAKARKNAPCIVFIDEMDAVGARRTGEQHSEDRKTLNALLTEMDGFKPSENIIVIGATNRIEDLDPALTRPGRFTNKFCVPLPETVSERLEIIELYTKNKKLAETFDVKALAKETVGFSPAKIEALLNEAAIISVQEEKNYIDKAVIDAAMYKVLLQGHAKINQKDRDKTELEIVAWHEAGHAVIGRLFGKDVTKVTIVSSTSGAGGVTFSTPTKTALLSQTDMKQEVMELYGGRVAELLYFDGDKGKVTTGASNDIERATGIIRDFVTKYGFTEDFGMLDLGKAGCDKEFIVTREVELAKSLENETESLLREHYDILKEIACRLIENETIYASDLDEIFEEAA